MKKDVNLIFFGLVIFLLISILGITLYYQETYKSLDASHREAMDKIIDTECKLNETMIEFKRKSAELDQRERDLMDILNELNISKQKISSLSSFYEEVASEKDDLEDKIDFAEADRDRYKLNLDETSQELLVCEKDKDLFTDQVSEANSKILQARNKIKENMSSAVLVLDDNLDSMDELLSEDEIFGNLDDIEEDLSSCNCSANEIDDLRESLEELESTVTRSKNMVNKINYIINKLYGILVAV